MTATKDIVASVIAAQRAAKAAGQGFNAEAAGRVIIAQADGGDIFNTAWAVAHSLKLTTPQRGGLIKATLRLAAEEPKQQQNKRTPEQISLDRQAIIDHVIENTQAGRASRQAEWMARRDVDALVKQGRLVREVRREYERQEVRDGLFGSTGNMRRDRAYLSLPRDAQ